MTSKFNANVPVIDKICNTSGDQEKLCTQRFHGKPVSIVLLKKSKTEKVKLIKKIDDILSFKNFPTKTIGKEKNKDKNNGISIKANGIRTLNESSNVNE